MKTIITEMQKAMMAAVGHEIEVELKPSGNVLKGRCTNYTQPLDNEPEVASIDIIIPGYSSIIGIDEEEIFRLSVLD